MVIPKNIDEDRQVMKVDPESLIARAIDKGLPVETMERLLAMRTQLKTEWMREEYFRELSVFQSKCPIIVKTREVFDKSNKLRYRFAPLDAIVAKVKSPLKKHGFSYTIKTKQENSSVTAIVEAHHVAGHTESTEFTVPIDADAYMNAAQKVASALTYSKRYAFCNAFGILTGDEDDDARAQGNGKKPENKDPLQSPQALQSNPSSTITEAAIPVAEDQASESRPYAEIMAILNAKEKSREGPMIALFASQEKIEWKAKADMARGNLEEILGLLQGLDVVSEQRRMKIKEGT